MYSHLKQSIKINGGGKKERIKRRNKLFIIVRCFKALLSVMERTKQKISKFRMFKFCSPVQSNLHIWIISLSDEGVHSFFQIPKNIFQNRLYATL